MTHTAFFITHHILRVELDDETELTEKELASIAQNLGQKHMRIYTGYYDTTIVVDPITFRSVRLYKLKMIDPKCYDICCLGGCDLYIDIEACAS